VRLRVDHFAGTDGVPAEGVIKSLSLIPVFADRWYPHIKDAMEKGNFDPSKPAKSEPESPSTSLVALCERAGGVNRVKALLRIRSRDRRDDAPG
jgi:hypothetical protein